MTAPPPVIPPHVSVPNHKGGVGKTSTIQGLAVAGAEAGERVLVVDMDAQGNATRRLRADLPDDPAARAAQSLAGVLERPVRGGAARVLTPCGYGGIYTERITVAPAHLDLELLARTAAQAAAERRLLTALTGVVQDYDLVLIDCPPNLLSHQIDIAWTASDFLFLPCEAEYDAVEAARRIKERVSRDRDTLNPDLEIAGIVTTRYRANMGVHQKRADEMEKIAGPGGVCPVRIPELAVVKNMSEFAKPLSECGSQGRDMASLYRDVYAWMRSRVSALTGKAPA